MVQCPRAQAATCSGRASVGGREQNRVDHLDVLPPLDGSGAADPDHLGGAGEVDPGGGLDGLDGAPHPPAVTGVDARDGRDVLPGQLLQLPFQAEPVALHGEHVVGAATADPLGGAGPGAPWRRRRRPHRPGPGGEQVGQGGDLVGLIRHSALPHDHAGGPARDRREVGAGLSPVRAPRMVSSSTAITLRPAMAPVRVKNQEARAGVEARGVQVLQDPADVVDSDGRARPSSRPRAPRSAGSRSAACSRIADLDPDDLGALGTGFLVAPPSSRSPCATAASSAGATSTRTGRRQRGRRPGTGDPGRASTATAATPGGLAHQRPRIQVTCLSPAPGDSSTRASRPRPEPWAPPCAGAAAQAPGKPPASAGPVLARRPVIE